VLNVANLLESSARDFPTREAVVLGQTRLTYAQVNGAANQVANALLEHGLAPGDKVALTCPNVPYFPIVYYGILKAGGVVVPLNVLLKNREIAYHLRDSDARFYFCFQGTPELPMGLEGHAGFTEVDTCEQFVMITADPVAPSPVEGSTTLGQLMSGQSPLLDSALTDATDTAVILYTSGTTGQPKGAELSHSNLVMNTVVCEKLFGPPPAGTHDVQLVALPLFHSFGQSVQMNTGFSMGATLVLLPRFEPVEALQTMDRENVTYFAGVPTMYWAMLSAGATGADMAKVAGNLRMAASGGASLPVEIIKTFKERFGVQILEGYGLSETSPVASFSRTDLEPRPGSIGVPVWGVQMMLVDSEFTPVPEGQDGEIAIRGHNIMKGYYGKPEATAEVMHDGWFRTGDIARRDEDGYYYIVDRAKDMIIRGGFNVYPREVEEVLMTHPAVSLAAVVGVKDEQYGEEVKAYVIKAPGATESEADLVEWGREQMAAHKYPRVVEFRESLPMNATGKILKRELR
jgi:long-chain acyl-CoA synthetase